MPRHSGPHTEQAHHKRAFEHYAAQGPGRKHQRTATDLGVSLAAVKAWSRSFRWKERIAERDAEATRQIADRAFATGAIETDRNLKIVHLGLLTLAKSIREGKIKGQMADVDRLIRLEEHLLGGEGRLCRDPAHASVDQIRHWSREQRWQFMVDAAIRTVHKHPEAMAYLRKEMETIDTNAPPDKA